MRFSLGFLCTFSLAALAADPEDDQRMAKKPFVPTDGYEEREVLGWKVRVNKELLGPRKETGDQALALLEEKLKEIREKVPPTALAALLHVTLWLGVDDFAVPNANYHPSAGWLKAHGWNPDKAKCVEISNAEIFLKWSRDQPMMILHELSHAYHDQVLGYGYAPIRHAYEEAKRSGKYEAVKRGNRTERAYALNNDQEFFAEASEAYFGRNDFQPFTREELKSFDPETYRVVEEAWNRPALSTGVGEGEAAKPAAGPSPEHKY